MTPNFDAPLHDDQLRILLDQRTARADLHSRFPSLSEISDSPSLYSHAAFSPQPSAPHESSVSPPHSFPLTPRSHHSSSSLGHPPLHFPDREPSLRFHPTSLNFEDGTRAFDHRSLHSSLSANDDCLSEDDFDDNHTEHNSEPQRLSVYGPKMTVHSRAPWELEDEEQDLPSRTRDKKSTGKPSKLDPPKRSWGLVSRQSNETRPSVDSVRSSAKQKQSFDTHTSNSSSIGSGANSALLYDPLHFLRPLERLKFPSTSALAQASFSSTSVAISPSPHSTLRDKLSIPRLRTRTASGTKGSKPEPVDTRPVVFSGRSSSPHTSPVTSYRTTSPSESVFSYLDSKEPTPSLASLPLEPQSPHEFRHPYANPELARTASPSTCPLNHRSNELHDLASSASYSSSLGPSESSTTLTDIHNTSGMSYCSSGIVISSTPKPSQPKIEASTPSLPRHLQSKSINKSTIRTFTHCSTSDTTSLPVTPASSLAGWSEHGSPSIKLISLAEAQAQARERSRSATANPSSPTVTRFNDAEPPAPSPTSQTWVSRIRSTSATSSRTRSGNPVNILRDLDHVAPPLPTCSSEQTILGRTVVKKKSGFMRLFNGRDSTSPPPMPSITTSVVASPSVQSVPTSRRQLHRVPVPSTDTENDLDVCYGTHPDPEPANNKAQQINARRNLPGLSIVTSSPSLSTGPRLRGGSVSPGTSNSAHVESSTTPTTAVTNVDSLLDCAAPLATPADFLGVSLRPFSAMFGSALADHLAERTSSDRGRPSLDVDLGTPTTSSGISPLSPGFNLNIGSRTEDKGMITLALPQEDQSAVIQALQEQILLARRAWQQQIWELEGQVRDLKAEVEDLRSADDSEAYCSACGRGSIGRPEEAEIRPEELKKAGVKIGGVIDRPRARTGIGSRFASGN